MGMRQPLTPTDLRSWNFFIFEPTVYGFFDRVRLIGLIIAGMFGVVLRNVVQAVLYWSKKILKNIHMTDE